MMEWHVARTREFDIRRELETARLAGLPGPRPRRKRRGL